MTSPGTRARRPVRRWLARLWPLLSSLVAACSGEALGCDPDDGAGAWVSEGGELGARVRAGELPGVSHLRMPSEALACEVGLVVVTPPGYDAGQGRHPVLYVFSGIGGDEWSYLRDVGLEGPAMRALRSAEPGPIVVMAHAGDSGASGPAAEALGPELVRFLDERFRTRAEARGRSLEGFSLGGVVALTLLNRYPALFGSAAAQSSACFLIDACPSLRASLREAARTSFGGKPVLLSVAEREDAAIREINEELAPIVGVPLEVLPGVAHDPAAQLRVPVRDEAFGVITARFHQSTFGAD